MNTRIDVLIPVYNGEKTIRSSISSIQQQTFSDITIVVVDDGSTDGTLTILNEMAAADHRLHIVSKPNGGIVEALNTGLEHCQSEFIARHDADDIAYPERFAKQLAYLQAHPDCLAVSSAARHIDGDDKPLGTFVTPQSPDNANPNWIPCKEPYLLHPFLMIRRAEMLAVGGYREVQASEDSDLYWRLQEKGRLHNTQDILGDYRMHAESISSKSIRNGRRMALGSQLGGISALRRRNGKLDITFGKERVKAYADAVTLDEFYRLGSAELSNEELLRLKISMAAKLMELASYRPFELDADDCHFIKTAFNEGRSLLNPINFRELESAKMHAAYRLIKKGLINEAFTLTSARLFFKMVFRKLVPETVRIKLRQSIDDFKQK